MRGRHLLLPALLLASALAVVGLLGSGIGESPDGSAPGADGRPADVTGPVLVGKGTHPLGDGPGGTASEALADPLPADLPPWGLRVRVETGSRDDPRPVAEASVRVALVSPEGVLFAVEGTTDATGAWRLAPLPLPAVPRRVVGALVLEATATGQGGAASSSRQELPGLAARIRRAPVEDGVAWVTRTLTLRAGRRIRGRLLTASGHPVEGIWIDTDPYEGGGSARSGWDGGFEIGFDDPTVEDLALMVKAIGAVTFEHRASVLAASEEDVVEVRLPGDADARGRVLDADGKPVAGVHLVLAPIYWDPNAGFALHHGSFVPVEIVDRLKTRSAADGRFAFPGLNADDSYVLWWPSTYEHWERLPDEVRRGDADLRVVLARHRFRPALVDALTRRPVYGEIRIQRLGQGVEMYDAPFRNQSATPQEEGPLGAPGDRFRIHAWSRGYAVASVDYTMPVEAGTHDVPVPLSPLAPGPVVRLCFVDADGEALGRVPFLLRRAIADFYPPLKLTIPSEEEEGGWVRFPGLPPGPIRLKTPEKLGHPPRGTWRFTLPLEDVRFEIPVSGTFERVVPCPQGGSVRLSLRSSPGAIAGTLGQVRLRHETGVEESPWWYALEDDGTWDFEIIGNGSFVPDGRHYESSVLRPGNWTLEIEANETWRAVSLLLRVAAGDITEVRVTLEPRN